MSFSIYFSLLGIIRQESDSFCQRKHMRLLFCLPVRILVCIFMRVCRVSLNGDVLLVTILSVVTAVL